MARLPGCHILGENGIPMSAADVVARPRDVLRETGAHPRMSADSGSVVRSLLEKTSRVKRMPEPDGSVGAPNAGVIRRVQSFHAPRRSGGDVVGGSNRGMIGMFNAP